MAVQKRFYVALDIKRPTANRDFEVVEGDNGNVLEIELTDDGTAVDLSGCLVVAVFSKSDGAAQQDSDGHGISVDAEQHNKLTISLYSTSVAPGLVECELQVFSGEDHATLVTSAKFNFMCRRGIANGDVVQATEEWPLLVDVLQRCELVEEAEAARVIVEAGRAANEEERQQSEAAREAFADKWRDMQLSVTGLPHTAAPTVNVTEEETRFSVSLGIPQGEPGTVNNHTHGNITIDGKIGTAAGFVLTDEDGEVYVEDNAATVRGAMGAAAQIDVDALEAAGVPITTGGTPTAYTITPTPAITSYVNNGSQIWTVCFHAESGENPTFNVSGLGALPLLQYYGKAAKVKGGQIVRVVKKGSNFFLASAGGGLDLPATISAGATTLYSIVDAQTTSNSSYADVGAGWGFQAVKAGTFRVKYSFSYKFSTATAARLALNGVLIAGSEITATTSGTWMKSVDVILAAGDVVKFQTRYNYTVAHAFSVSILAADLQTVIDGVITVL